jgi:7-cyano-7-deazaguanine synthase
MTVRRVIVLASGGIDSTACLFYYKELGYNVEALFVDYGHPANPAEYEHIDALCKRYEFPLSLLKLSGTTIESNWEIRGRNAFLIIAALVARPAFTGLLSLGIHGGSPYYDCGQKFVQLMENLVINYTKGTVQLDLPLMEMDKATVIHYCRLHKVPLELTYSCQAGKVPPCGNCPSCRDRSAFRLGQ